MDIDPYRLVLDAWQDLRRSVGLSDDPRALRDLQPAVRELRQGMENERVSFEYGGDLALAYAFAYYPASTSTLLYALGKIGPLPSSSRSAPFRTLVLGAGPAPEIFAVDEFVHRTRSPIHLEFQLIDCHSGWTPIRRALRARIEAARPARTLRSWSKIADLGSRNCADAVCEFAPQADLVIMQNVLNELDPGTSKAFPKTFSNWIARTRPATPILILDNNTPESIKRIKDLHGALSRVVTLHTDRIRGWRPIEVEAPDATAAPEITRYLLTGDEGLMMRGTVKCHYIVGRRR